MAVSIVDLYKNVLPKTNCRDCGFPTCMAFASMVISEKHPLDACPHIGIDTLRVYREKIGAQQASGKWLKKDMAKEALEWARARAASMAIEDLPDRIGGRRISGEGASAVELSYFNDILVIRPGQLSLKDGSPLNRWEQVFVYNHLAQGGEALPTGKWKGLEEIPNTVSKIKSMREYVEIPLIERFSGNADRLEAAAVLLGGKPNENGPTADVAVLFLPLPRIPVLLLFWDAEPLEGFEAKVKLLFDETIVGHLDIESILFLSEHLRQRLCEIDSRRSFPESGKKE